VEPCRQTLSPKPLRNTVPVELTEQELHDTVAVMGEWDQDGAREAQSALEWLGWEGEGSLFLRRYDVQLFVWYTLPRKFLTSLESKREVAEMLAGTLERLGGRAASYADVCRSAETHELLCAAPAKPARQFRDRAARHRAARLGQRHGPRGGERP
jgi:hypothetical protein